MKYNLLCKVKTYDLNLNDRNYADINLNEFKELSEYQIFELIKNKALASNQNNNYIIYLLYNNSHDNSTNEQNVLCEFEDNVQLNVDSLVIYKNKKYKIQQFEYDIDTRTCNLYINYTYYDNESEYNNFLEKIKLVNNLIEDYNKNVYILNKLDVEEH